MHIKPLQRVADLILVILLLSGCSQSAPIAPAATEIPTTVPSAPAGPTPAYVDAYEPIDAAVCRMLQETATQALGVEFSLEEQTTFLDELAGETGLGCRLTAVGDGNRFAGPQAIMDALISSIGLGWNEQPEYQADGPTGTARALARDMALMLVSAEWAPVAGVVCPADRPISDCNLTPDQKIYTVRIDIAQYKATFSLDGHWEDAATGFSLNLYQEWKHIYGSHTAVAQNGNKIDSLDVSIDGSLQGTVATVRFQSSFTPDAGVAQITYVDGNTIVWKIITPPDGEYYLPAEARLTRK